MYIKTLHIYHIRT